MKHPTKATLIILAMFIIAQFIGLLVMSSYDNYFGSKAQEKIKTGELIQPEVSIISETIPEKIELKTTIDIMQVITIIIISLILATLFFFLLYKVRFVALLKIWFAFVVFISLSISFSLILYYFIGINLFNVLSKNISLAEIIAVPLAAVFTFYKIVKRNMLAHNFSEVFVYPGLAVIFLPLLNVIAASVLLVFISIYDIIAVWKTKHMIKLAKFQINKMKIFTGFFIPYLKPKDKVKIQKMQAMAKLKGKKLKSNIKIKVNIAALGGGDVAFPLMFTGTIFFAYGLLAAIITILTTALALFLLLLASKKGKFYPAMPFLSAGCFLGLFIALLI